MVSGVKKFFSKRRIGKGGFPTHSDIAGSPAPAELIDYSGRLAFCAAVILPLTLSAASQKRTSAMAAIPA